MKRIGICILAALMFLPAAFPQASTSTVRGTVRDQGQAVVPKATVTLTNTATNVARTTESNDAGGYVFPNTFPGPYKVSVEFAGMQKYEATFTVQAQQDATIEVTLQVGQVGTQVEVMDVTPLLNVANSAQAHTVERQKMEQLPVNGRGYQAFLATVPGIDSTGLTQAYGMRTNTSTSIFDGAPINEVWEGWDFGRVPGLDALQEIHVETNNSSAKFARPTTILLTSKSGSNQIHGALFETIRNSGFGVARRRQDTFTKAPYLNRNEYGASMGGPIFIPKLYDGRNKTFFFFAYEAVRSLTYATNQYAIPTEAMMNGDFTQLKDSQGRLQVLYDPYTTNPSTWARQPLSYNGVANMIDPARIVPLAKKLFSMTPKPNVPGVNPLLGSNLVLPVPTPDTSDTTSIRIDHRFSDKDLIFGRFSRGRRDHLLNITPMLNSGIGDYEPTVTSNRHWPNTTAAITWVKTISPTFTNEVLVNFSRDYHWRGSGDRHTNYAAALGLPNPFAAFNWPSVSGSGIGSWPFGTQNPFWLITNYAIIQDNATKIQGKHEFQFGVGGRYEMIDRNANSTAGAFDAGTLATSLYDTNTASAPAARAQTGSGLANIELGVLNYSASFRRRWFHFRRSEATPYFQDNWKVTSRLTINLGLRYELRTPLYDRDGTLLGFDFAKHAMVTGTSPDNFIKLGMTTPAILSALKNFGGNLISYQDATDVPQKLQHQNWKELGPHLGFAYRALDGKKAFVVRGGYRKSFYAQKLQDWVGSQSSSIPVGATFANTVSNTALSPDGVQNYGLRSVPVYRAGINTPDSIINTTDTRLLARGFNVGLLDPYHSEAVVQDWNLTFEKEIMANTIVRIGYIGNHGSKQQQEIHYNDSTPAYIWYQTKKAILPQGEFSGVATRPYDQQVYGNITLYAPTGYSNYHGAQFELERRFSKGFSYQLFWNFGNTLLINQDIDDSQSGENMPSINVFLPGAVPQDFDTRNRFLNYRRDTNTPKHNIKWNFIAELPFGKGKKFFGGARGVVDKLIGGWQVSGLGSMRQPYMTFGTGNYPTGAPVEFYGFKYPIQDCSDGANCYSAYLYWNGYIPANRINSVDANGKPNGYMGIPSNYKPAAAPLIPYGQTALPANAPANTVVSDFWDTNTVWIPLTGVTNAQRVVFNDNLHPWRNQYHTVPWTWSQDLSAVKFVNITEKLVFRFNFDAFNAFNHPNNAAPSNSTGVLSQRNSGSNARVVQLGARLSW